MDESPKIAIFNTNTDISYRSQQVLTNHLRATAKALCHGGAQVCLITATFHDNDLDVTEPDAGSVPARGLFDLDIEILPLLLNQKMNDVRSDYLRTRQLVRLSANSQNTQAPALDSLVCYDNALGTLLQQPVDAIYEFYNPGNLAGIALARRLGVPHLLEFSPAVQVRPDSGAANRTPATHRYVFDATDRVLVESWLHRRMLENLEIDSDRIHLLPDPVISARIAHWQNENATSPQSIQDRFFIAARLSSTSHNESRLLLQALRQFCERQRNVKLQLLSMCQPSDEIAGFVREYGLERYVTVAGGLTPTECRHHLKAADVIVANSTSDNQDECVYDNVVEWLSVGKTVVAERREPFTSLLDDGKTGMTYLPGHSGHLAAVLEDFSGNLNECRVIGKRAQMVTQQKHTWEERAAAILQLVRSLRKREKFESENLRSVINS